MDLNSILIGSENPQGLRDYYNKIFGKPVEEGDFSGWQDRQRLGNRWTARSGERQQQRRRQSDLEHRDI